MANPEQSINGDGNNQAGGDLTINNHFRVENISKRPSQIAKVVAILSTKMDQSIPRAFSSITQYDIEDKISHNNLKKYKSVIDRYGFYGGFIETICKELDADKPNSKSRMFEYIKSEYIKERDQLLQKGGDSMAIIRDNSDKIIDSIYSSLKNLVEGCTELSYVDEEDVRVGLLSLIAVAFIECNILERPNK